MKKIALAVRLKHKMYSLKFSLWRHRVEYWLHCNTEEAVVGSLLFSAFVLQFLLYMAGR